VRIDTRLSKPFFMNALRNTLAAVAERRTRRIDRRSPSLDPIALIDRDFLEMQVDALGAARLTQLTRLFQRTSRQLLEAFDSAVSAGDRANVQRLAHQLYSASSALGFGRLCAEASAVEAGVAAMTDEELIRKATELGALRRASLTALSAAARQ
jgi:hypothetical protein